MSDSYKLQVSPKTPNGTLVNIQGDTPEELAGHLKSVLSGELLQLIVQTEAAILAGVAAAPLVTPQAAPAYAPQEPQNGYQQGPPPSWAPQPGEHYQGAPVAPQQPQYTPQPVQAAQPAAPGGFCNHGPRTVHNGTYKSGPNQGKAYTAYFCPQPKGAADQCKPVFT